MVSECLSDLVAAAEELLEARDLDAAWAAYQIAEAAGAEPNICCGGRWMVAMLRGDFEAAWCESDAIRSRGEKDRNRFWTGEDFTGKRVILRCLHGYGDTVQLLRYAPRIAELAQDLVVEVAPAMVDLAKMFDSVEKVITWGSRAPAVIPDWDVQMEINELPYIFRSQPEDLPLATEYLNVRKWLCHTAADETRRPGSLRVGVVWASGEWNPSRSVPASLLQPLLSTPGVEFWNLQGGTSRTQWECFAKGTHLHAAEECAESIELLAGFIAQLDLVITPDTLAAHLAGALGTPAWVMLEYAADWRWQHGRDDSPWYPSLRLFRQQQPHDWNSVLVPVRNQLEQLAALDAKDRMVAW